MTEERRQHPRYETTISVVLYAGSEIITARAKNVSIGGMGLHLRREVEDGTKVSLSFHLLQGGQVDETTPRLTIEGNVMWSAPMGDGKFDVGIKFAQLGTEERAHLNAYIGLVSR